MKNPNVIDQFMWGYQPHYYISLKLFAERFFNSILPNIFNQVFLVGTLIPGETDRNKVCIQQEDDEYSQNDFSNYEELYEQLLQVSPGNHVFQSHPIAQEHHRQNVEKSALRDSIKKCVEQKAVFHDVITFVSTYSPIEKFNVSIVLQLNKKEYDSFYKLFKESDNRFSISKSIIDSAVPLFFTEALKALRDKESDGTDLCSVDEEYLRKKVEELKHKNQPIPIDMEDGTFQYLYYDDSINLKRLLVYPYAQLSVMAVFILLAFIALASTKRAEQNKVWVGLSKETAHQLGTPISSLIAWLEYLKLKDIDPTLLTEMEKDVKRLEMIAERFSKIGSTPEPVPVDICQSINSAVEYMQTRISSKVKISIEAPGHPVVVLMNNSLFSWVVENLCKNAVDAMEGQGSITFHIEEKGKNVRIDVTDTGKGILKSRFKTVFNPGYTTKKRGWGLGLSLVKRIVESYHGGKIFVKSSEIGKGTTFRIELRLFTH